MRSRALLSFVLALALAFQGSMFAQGAGTQKPFEPQVGQPGKDVVWVPTPQPVVEKMLDLAKVTPSDVVMDLGSGDGRTVITAAKRGAQGIGVEFNPDMVALSKQNAAAAGVGAKATFIEGDLYEADLSKASVITMFLLPSINMKLRPQILDLKPGTRIVSNTFTMEDWQADETFTVTDGCSSSWCTALLWIVPARVEGTWTLPQGELKLTQAFQYVTGSLGTASLQGRVRGDELSFTVGTTKYVGRVNGNRIAGTAPNSWSATKKG
jgi:precorrin-6B methylase 2